MEQVERIFRRKIYSQMLKWKQERDGKTALLIKGAWRVGKSTIAEQFARNEYESYIVVDFADAPDELWEAVNHISDRNLFLPSSSSFTMLRWKNGIPLSFSTRYKSVQLLVRPSNTWFRIIATIILKQAPFFPLRSILKESLSPAKRPVSRCIYLDNHSTLWTQTLLHWWNKHEMFHQCSIKTEDIWK